MKLFLVALFCGLTVGQQLMFTQTVPELAVTSIRDAGLDILSADIQQLDADLEDAIAAFIPANASCMAKYDDALSSCRTCVQEKCRARGESECRPEDWQIFLGETINFFTSDVPDFFTDTIPDVFVDKIGGGVVDITHEAIDFFTDDIIGGTIDFGETIGEGAVDFGEGVVDVGITIGEGISTGIDRIEDGFNDAVDVLENVGEEIKDTFENVGNFVSGFFGKRELRKLARRESEPSCSDIESDAATACQFYLKPAYCPSCGFDTETECPDYTAALAQIQAANDARAWMAEVTDDKFYITEMTFNPFNMDPNTGDFSGVEVTVHLFGKEMSFTVREPVNPYVPTTAGPIVAQQALDTFKSS